MRRRDRSDGYFWLTMENRQARLDPLVDLLYTRCTGAHTMDEIAEVLVHHGHDHAEALRLTEHTMDELVTLGFVLWVEHDGGPS